MGYVPSQSITILIFSWSRKIDPDVRRDSGIAHFRSLAIDHLSSKQSHENVKVIYIYFDYKSSGNQTARDIAANFLKQLLYLDEKIPEDIESLYRKGIQTNSNPNIGTLSLFLAQFSQTSPISVVVDALDECSDDNLEDVLSLLSTLEKAGFNLLVSTRPHIRNFSSYLTSIQNFTITAETSDLENYILSRLKKAGNRNSNLVTKCVGLINGIQGM